MSDIPHVSSEEFYVGSSKGYQLIRNGRSAVSLPDVPIVPPSPDIPWTPIGPSTPIEPPEEPIEPVDPPVESVDPRQITYQFHKAFSWSFGDNNHYVSGIYGRVQRIFATEEDLIQGLKDYAIKYWTADAKFRVDFDGSDYADYKVLPETISIVFPGGLSTPVFTDLREGLRMDKDIARGRIDISGCPLISEPHILSESTEYVVLKITDNRGNVHEGTLAASLTWFCGDAVSYDLEKLAQVLEADRLADSN